MHGLVEDRVISPWLRMSLTLLATTVVAYFIASGVVTLMVDPTLPAMGDDDAKVAKAAGKVSVPSLNFFAPITGRNAFKAAMPKPKVEKKAQPVEKDISTLQVAQINAQLLGTMYSDVSILSRAVVFENKVQRLVKIGDTISGYAIDDIQRRAIVLKKGSQSQLLLIDAQDKNTAGKKSEARKMLSRQTLKAKLQDLDALAKEIQLAPATRGKQQGLWIRQLQAGSLFSKAGLQKDDVLLNVGGMDVAKANPVTLFKMLEKDQVVVSLLRNGKPMQLVLLLTGK